MQAMYIESTMNKLFFLLGSLFNLGKLPKKLYQPILAIIAYFFFFLIFTNTFFISQDLQADWLYLSIRKTVMGLSLLLVVTLIFSYYFVLKFGDEKARYLILDKLIGLVIVFCITSPTLLIFPGGEKLNTVLRLFFVLIYPAILYFVFIRKNWLWFNLAEKYNILVKNILTILISFTLYHATLMVFLDILGSL